MSPFVPTGYLTPTAAIDHVVELMQGGDPSLLFTEEERTILRDLQEQGDQAAGREPREAVPVAARAPTNRTPGGHVEVEPPRSSVTAEEVENLLRKEAYLVEQRPAAGEILRQLLYAGQVPSETITKEGYRIKTPKHVWGGNWWYMALKINTIQHAHGLGGSVFGRPIIRRDALEAAFNSDGTVKEESEPPETPEAIDEEPAKQSNRGRPPNWPREVWLECLLDLSLRGEVSLTHSQESIAEALASELENVTGKKPSINTVKKDWLRPILKKAKNGDNSSD